MTENEKLIIFKETKMRFKLGEEEKIEHLKPIAMAKAYELVHLMRKLNIFEEFKVWDKEQN